MMKKHKGLILGGLVSILLLILFIILQSTAPSVLQLPIQWLILSLIPTAITLIAGRYIGKIEASTTGFKFEGVDKELEALSEAKPTSATTPPAALTEPWQSERQKEYVRTNNLVLVHTYKPSIQHAQEFDVFIYLAQHAKGTIHPKRTGFPDVKQVEFFLGAAWGNHIFTVDNTGRNVLGIRAHAFGTFLVTCRVLLRDDTKPPIILHRYIDCEMLHLVITS